MSSSDDEGTLSGLEKLVSSLEKFTKLIVKSIKSTDLKELGMLQFCTIDVHSVRHQSRVNSLDSICVTEEANDFLCRHEILLI